VTLAVGQKLWFVPSDTRYNKGPQECEVAKIGRKWAYLNWRGYRLDINSLRVDGGDYSSPGRCWLSVEEYESHVNSRAVWDAFRKAIDYKPIPDGVTVEHIEEAARLLKLVLVVKS
jgi:hypothetical protein